MTDQTPIERAAQAIQARYEDPIPDLRRWSDSRAVFKSIDTDELADVILAANLFGDGTAMDAALAVKNWLTGKDNQ